MSASQYADTGGFTDHVFAVTSILGYRFVPRIRDLPSKRIYLFDPAACPKELRGLIGGKLRQSLIASNWPDILRPRRDPGRAGTVAPSLILRKLAAYPRRNDLAAALREVGRIERHPLHDRLGPGPGNAAAGPRSASTRVNPIMP